MALAAWPRMRSSSPRGHAHAMVLIARHTSDSPRQHDNTSDSPRQHGHASMVLHRTNGNASEGSSHRMGAHVIVLIARQHAMRRSASHAPDGQPLGDWWRRPTTRRTGGGGQPLGESVSHPGRMLPNSRRSRFERMPGALDLSHETNAPAVSSRSECLGTRTRITCPIPLPSRTPLTLGDSATPPALNSLFSARGRHGSIPRK